jgi:inner membrane protein
MDPLTHTATGLFLGRAGLKRLTPYATPILLLAANAPDIDIVTTAGGALNYLHFHRHLTHSLLAMPVLAILTVLLVRGVTRRPIRWLGAFVAALVAVGSHLLLDWTNLYGIRLLLPFSNAWQRLDLTQVIDLWIWGVLLLGIAGPFLARLVGSEITSGKAPSLHHGRGFALFALAFVLLYNGGRAVLHSRAVAALDSRLYDGQSPARVAAFPTLNPLVWRGLIETGAFVEIQDVNLAGHLDLNRGMIFHKPYPDPALDAARATPTFQTFLNFSQFPLWRVTPVAEPDNGKLVEVFDLRFGTPAQPGFMVAAVLDSRDNVTQTTFQFGTPRPR